MEISGAILLGGRDRLAEITFAAVAPATGKPIGPPFSEAGAGDVDAACTLAQAASHAFAELPPERRAAFLEAVAAQIEAIEEPLVERALQETGLPRARLHSETGRTTGQLRLFAGVVRQGEWLDVTIDPALAQRVPLPRPDLRRCNLAIGPVAVFGASNFPLAFSVAGGDTASAFAAGCPVVVKGHPAHPGTGELVARAVRAAVSECGLPEGVFSYLPGSGIDLGRMLVADPRIKAVGFTGSRGAGMALVEIAAARAEPIPVYAEMSSINPVILFPAAAAARGDALGQAFVQSLTLGAGQFCTSPGLVIALDGPELDGFVAAAQAAMAASAAQPMLTPAIHASYERGVGALVGHDAIATIARGRVGEGVNQACGAIFSTDVAAFLRDGALAHEVFGASSILVRAANFAEVETLLGALDGQLTTTLLFDDADIDAAERLMPILAGKAGRILGNGWPTGVEVCHAMVHGGPYPATSDGRTTSVGALAIARFLRPVCYQNLPDRLLPAALRAANPWRVSRRIDGILEPV